MEQRHRNLLEVKRLEIISDLRFRHIRRHLLDNRILNGTDLDDIESEETRRDQVEALLDILPNRGPNAFAVFRDALKHRYPHLARILKDGGQEEEAKQNEPRIFIIHAGEDKDSFVRPLFSTLMQQGLAEKDIFFDDSSIKPGEVIRDRIISALSSQNLELAVIVVSTSLLNKHYWPKLELETCLRNNKPIFPIWVDANTDNFMAFSELVGKYSPTLKQLRARCVQRHNVTDELPKVAAEVVKRVSTLKCTPFRPTEKAVKEFSRLSIAPESSLSTAISLDASGANVEQVRPPSPWKEEVSCSSYISHADIAGFFRDHRDRLTDTDRRLLQHAMTLVNKESSFCNDAQITVYGELMTAVFYSGEKTNKYVVRLVEGKPIDEVEDRGWGKAARDTAQSGFNWVKDSVRRAVSGAAGSGVGRLIGGLFGGFTDAIGWK